MALEEFIDGPVSRPRRGRYLIGLSPKPRDGLTAIYLLRDPNGLTRYIGKTVDPRMRLSAHCATRGAATVPVVRWCAKLKRAGHAPIMDVIAWVEDWQPWERCFIEAGRLEGLPLLNICHGGEGPHVYRVRLKPYPALRKALSIARRQTEEPEFTEAFMKECILKASHNDELKAFDQKITRCFAPATARRMGYRVPNLRPMMPSPAHQRRVVAEFARAAKRHRATSGC